MSSHVGTHGVGDSLRALCALRASGNGDAPYLLAADGSASITLRTTHGTDRAMEEAPRTVQRYRRWTASA